MCLPLMLQKSTWVHQADLPLSAPRGDPCLQDLQGLAEGRNLDLAQVPEELQGNLFTAAVAVGMRVVPHIKHGSSRLKHRRACLPW